MDSFKFNKSPISLFMLEYAFIQLAFIDNLHEKCVKKTKKKFICNCFTGYENLSNVENVGVKTEIYLDLSESDGEIK